MDVEGELSPGYREYDFGPLFLSQAEEITGEEEFYKFVQDVYSTYGSKITESEDILEIMKKHCSSEELNELISYYFESV